MMEWHRWSGTKRLSVLSLGAMTDDGCKCHADGSDDVSVLVHVSTYAILLSTWWGISHFILYHSFSLGKEVWKWQEFLI